MSATRPAVLGCIATIATGSEDVELTLHSRIPWPGKLTS